MSTSRWIVVPKPNARAGLRLFCFPYAGGGASIFTAWPEWLPITIEVIAVQLPGRGRRISEEPYTSLSDLVGELVQVLLPSLEKPFAFFGHSMGALLAFESARVLRSMDGPTPAHLTVSGAGAPQVPDPDPPIHDLPDREFLKEIKQLNGTPIELFDSKEMVEIMLPTLRADFAVIEDYVYTPQPPLRCPILAIGSSQDRKVGLERIEAWRCQTEGHFSLRTLPGDHFYLRSRQRELLATLAYEYSRLIPVS